MAEPDSLESAAPAEAAGGTAADSSEKPTTLSCLKLPSFSEACGFINSRLEGVPVAYDNIKLIGELGDIFDDIGYIHINVEADFVIFQPEYGQKLVGVVNKKAPSHLGCLVHGCFNASIPRPMKMSVEAWQHLEVNIGDELEFEVTRLDSDAAGVFCIRGRMDRKMEAEAIENFNAMSVEQNANVPDNDAQNSTEIPEEDTAGETSILSGHTSKKKSKKRSFEETLSQNEGTESQGDESLSLVETPKNKRKKRKHQEPLSQDSVEVDGHNQDDHDATLDSSVVGLENTSEVTSSKEHKSKKSKKKKRRDYPNLESSVQNGIMEDSLVTDDSILTSETDHGSTKKKHKRKHKASTTLDQDSENGVVTASSQESPIDYFITQQETPKVKKHKKKHRNPTEMDSETSAFQTDGGVENTDILASNSQDVSEHKVKKKKRRKEPL
ncbi:DNA-directed RNA polymerase I subunit RPA43 isoform X2 [Dendropsophus ebraccatus]|uniref:DNA-directed RNA polymerase I subunit RPA43 isoform X2 n=1 Tax=Dendropsophus ebraccatus TaxID=150705 RepID=UPI003831A0BD